MGLIFALFDAASLRDVPFRQPQQFQCLHHGFTKAYLCSPFPTAALVTIYGTHIMTLVRDLDKCSAGRGALTHFSLAGLIVEILFMLFSVYNAV